MHILILCEDEMLRELLGQNLVQEGLFVTEASGLQDERADGHPPDVVVVDAIGRDDAAGRDLDGLIDVFGELVPPVVLLVGSVSRPALRAHPLVAAVIAAPFRSEALVALVVEVHVECTRGLVESGLRVRLPESLRRKMGLKKVVGSK